MVEFAYTARDGTGKQVEGTLDAGSRREVVATLTSRELFPVTVTAANKGRLATTSPRVRAKVIAPLYNQLAALLRSGVPLLRSLAILREQTSDAALRIVLNDVYSRVEEGATLAEAMARHPRAFSELAVSIARAGGEGGFLEEALERLALFTEQQDELKSRVIGALAYPVILAVVGTVVVNVLVIFFVPKFETLFARLKQRGELPAVTEWLIWLSESLQRYGILMLLAILVAAWLIKARIHTDSGRWLVDGWKIRIPQAGTIYLNLAVARFCRVLGTLLSGGVPIVRSLKISADATGNRVLAKAIDDAAENITAGQSLAPPLAASGHFPRNVVEMIAVAEESNTLDTVLIHIADTFERETSRRLELFVRLLEPLMLLILAAMVLVVVIALLLPILKMSMTL